MPKSRFLLPVGRYSVFGKSAAMRTTERTVKESTSAALRRALFITRSVKPFTNPETRPARESSFGMKRKRPGESVPPVERYFEAAEGMTVIDTTRLRITETLMAMAMSRKSCPVCSSTNMTGMNTAAVVRVLASTAPQTSVVPS